MQQSQRGPDGPNRAADSPTAPLPPPMAHMAVSFTLEPDDLRAFQRYARKHLPQFRRLRYVWGALLVVAGVVAAMTLDGLSLAWRIAYVLVFVAFVWGLCWLLSFLFRRIIQWRMLTSEKQRGLLCQHTCTLADDALMVVSPFNQSRCSWQGIYMIVDTAKYIYVFLTVSTAFIVPKRAFPSEEQARLFYERSVNLHARAQQAAG